MTFDEMCIFVRAHADADATDAPSSTLLVYARMAYHDILSRRNAWPYLEVQYNLTTIAGQSTYLLSGLTSGTDMELVTQVIATSQLGNRLLYITRSDADLYFGAPVAPASSLAAAYTIYGTSSIILYPTPGTSGIVYRVSGFRNPADWPTTAGSVADLPTVFHEAICWFMLGNYYMAQEDMYMSQTYMQEYEKLADRLTRNEATKMQSARPSVVGGNNSRFAPRFLDRVRGSLE